MYGKAENDGRKGPGSILGRTPYEENIEMYQLAKVRKKGQIYGEMPERKGRRT